MNHPNNEIEKQILKLEVLKKQLEIKSNNISVAMGQNYGKIATTDFESLGLQLQQVQNQIANLEKQIKELNSERANE